MTESYEDYDRQYNDHLAKIRSFLAGQRTRETLTECERLLGEAQRCATAMVGLAEVEGNPNRVRESKLRVERDIGPLSKEVKRQLNDAGRQELFPNQYAAPDLMEQGYTNSGDMDHLLQSSDDLLRESLGLCADTEEIGTSTLLQMGRQREQLETTAGHIRATRTTAEQAGLILKSMSAKAFRSKAFLKGMIVFLGLLNLWAFVHMFRRKK